MQQAVEHHFARTMYLLGQIGAILCHERGPRSDTSILTTMASRPAEGFWQAVSAMNESCPPTRSVGRNLLRWKRHEIARLSQMLPRPLPDEASSLEQMPFWAGYCEYWNRMLKTPVDADTNGASSIADQHPLRHVNA
ncbi:hypothetical protein BVER_05921c [Candidatus Burkholderia verschuerenii]|uniref:Uncharacterized protein n=1 Tax=Candidatus Burkholderia verschuerenii TaxID=242163 RepID=A0A0L0MHR3_9BURK|nr:hypothetical protein [Candidatus Burkholderia verschuerenii]KND61863.1 hypothetical protein BVER_05921c [Candidatus Burkholderia verschuerenii]